MSIRRDLDAYACYFHKKIFFIDGTVAGTDIYTGNVDSNHLHDHTYFGLGCENAIDASKPGYGGSTEACSIGSVETKDGEALLIGAYYNFQAATSGSGGPVNTDNTNVPDSFCPLSWQLPYDGTGGDYYDKSKSWNYLLNGYSISHNPGGETSSNTIRSFPFSYIESGRYDWNLGRLFGATNMGEYWASTNYVGTSAYKMRIWSNDVTTSVYDGKQHGRNLRCAVCFSILLPLRVRICVIQKLKASFHFFISLIHRRHGGRDRRNFR